MNDMSLETPTDTMDVEEVVTEVGGSPAPDPMATDDNAQFTGEYTWRFNKADALNCNQEKWYSDIFELGTYTWRILSFPRGNQKKQMLSLYLDAPETHLLPPSMCPKAAFTFTIVNQLEEGRTWSKEATHSFTTVEADWGFTETLPLNQLYDEQFGYCVDDIIIIKVKVTVMKDQGDSSRKETGFVGLKNQGATCYMNSLLQYLYNLPFFRKAVYDMPTSETDEASKNMPLALQSLFFKLQYSRCTVATKDLTKSFGWTNQDAFLQHDVQELNRVLCEKLEEKMKGTRVDKVINELFEGHTINYIKCINIDYTSERRESYMDLQLDVKGCRNIYESFDRYTENEVMNGQNQYMADGHGLQDAEKGVLFESFPPVLQLQLKRFEYDFQRDTMVKINDRYEFYDELDLDREDRKYLSKQARQQTERNVYRLHSVLVHSGGVHGGHYYAFVRPDGHTWLRFDDERVTKETTQKAMDEQFGEDEQVLAAGGGMYGMNAPHMRFPKHSNAYMLVYIRLDDWDRIMCPVSKTHLDPALLARFEAELAEKQRRQKEKREAHMYVSVKVASDCDIRDQIASGHRAFDLVDHDLLDKDRGAFRVKKYMRLGEFKAMVASCMGVPISQQRLWAWGRRPNGTQRVTTTLNHIQDDTPLLDIKEFREQGFPSSGPGACKTALMDIRLYLETPGFRPPDNLAEVSGELFKRNINPSTGYEDVLVFIKQYDPYKESLSFVGKGYFPLDSKVLEIAKHVMKTSQLPPDYELEVFEEVKPEPTLMIQPLKKKCTLLEAKLEDGDILVVQPRVSEEQLGRLRLPSIEKYLQYVQQRRIVLFKPLVSSVPPATAAVTVTGNGAPDEAGSGADAQGPGVHLMELRQDMNYEEVTSALAGRLGMLPAEQGATLLRLTPHNQYTNSPQRAPLKWRNVQSLQGMLMQASNLMRGGDGMRHQSGSHFPSDVLYYEVLDMPLEQLELLKTIKVYVHKNSGEFISEHVVRLPKDHCSVHHLLDEVAKQLGPTYADKPLRLVEVHSSKMYKLFSPNDSISDTLDDLYWRLRVEVVPQDEMGLDTSPSLAGERLLYCCHCLQDKAAAAAPVLGPVAAPASPALLSPPGPQPMDVSQGIQGPGSPVSQPGGGVQGQPVLGPLHPSGSQGLSQLFNNVTTFGDPLMVKCGPDDTLADVRTRVQSKLGVSDEDLSKWRWFFCSHKGGVEYLRDEDSVGARLARLQTQTVTAGNEQPFLGMEHEDDRPRRPVNNSRVAYERPVKITLQ